MLSVAFVAQVNDDHAILISSRAADTKKKNLLSTVTDLETEAEDQRYNRSAVVGGLRGLSGRKRRRGN